jgi:cytochrome P450
MSASALPPGPSNSMALMVAYFRDPIGCMVPIAKKYGNTFTLPGKPPLIVTGDPAGIKAIYSAEPDTFAPMNQDMSVFLGKNSLILQSGAAHKRGRRLMMPPFHGARMRAYGESMRLVTEQNTADWTKGKTVTAFETAQKISLDVILRVIFGVSEPEPMSALSKALLDLLNGFSPLLAVLPAIRHEFGGFGPFAKFRRRQTVLNAQLDGLIAARRADGPHEDILSMLIAARYEGDEPLSDEEIREQLLLLVVAGHETTGISIAWALYALHRTENAAALERLRAELDALGPNPDITTLDNQPYLEAVCQETLRRFPIAPAPSPRKLMRPMDFMGYSLPEGTGLGAAEGIAHFREDLYPDPMRFLPERFIDRKYTPFEFLPFGGGARRCLGAAMASYEMRLVLATIMRRFRLRLASQKPDPGKVRAANAGPKTSIAMVVEERRD